MSPNPRPPELADPSPLPVGIHARWTWHYQMLAELRDQLLRDSAANEWAIEEFPVAPRFNCATIAGQAEFEVILARLKQEDRALFEVEAALQRLHRGIYGRCELTRRPIPPARLRMFPWARVQPAARRQ